MDIRKVKKLIELIDATGVAEIEIHEGKESVRICRNPALAPAIGHAYQTAIEQPPCQNPIDSTTNGPASELKLAERESIINSPMVGTAYFAPAPDVDPFVSIGQEVTVGDTLCLIEAMKMFNEIEVDVDGRITEIHVENAQPVEFGQPLFTIEQL
jgi:acetyl-CoA carboxylase biotin carboxyl carrier protein